MAIVTYEIVEHADFRSACEQAMRGFALSNYSAEKIYAPIDRMTGSTAG